MNKKSHTPEIDFTSFANAIETLKAALSKPPNNNLERDGTIHRFKYTFELCWKAIRKVLLTLGRTEVNSSPKPLLRDALEEGLIENIEAWFEFLEARNHVSHGYNQRKAEQVFESSKAFLPHAVELLAQLEKRIQG